MSILYGLKLTVPTALSQRLSASAGFALAHAEVSSGSWAKTTTFKVRQLPEPIYFRDPRQDPGRQGPDRPLAEQQRVLREACKVVEVRLQTGESLRQHYIVSGTGPEGAMGIQHAKLLLIRYDCTSLAFFGSSNFTTASRGNLEIAWQLSLKRGCGLEIQLEDAGTMGPEFHRGRLWIGGPNPL